MQGMFLGDFRVALGVGQGQTPISRRLLIIAFFPKFPEKSVPFGGGFVPFQKCALCSTKGEWGAILAM